MRNLLSEELPRRQCCHSSQMKECESRLTWPGIRWLRELKSTSKRYKEGHRRRLRSTSHPATTRQSTGTLDKSASPETTLSLTKASSTSPKCSSSLSLPLSPRSLPPASWPTHFPTLRQLRVPRSWLALSRPSKRSRASRSSAALVSMVSTTGTTPASSSPASRLSASAVAVSTSRATPSATRTTTAQGSSNASSAMASRAGVDKASAASHSKAAHAFKPLTATRRWRTGLAAVFPVEAAIMSTSLISPVARNSWRSLSRRHLTRNSLMQKKLRSRGVWALLFAGCCSKWRKESRESVVG